ncbi:MAG TPA: hypothetical protein VGL93_15560 [Streptosporangiaceae bacterium]
MTVGNAVLGCPPGEARCAQAQQRGVSAGNNAFDMRNVNADPSVGSRNSSVAQVMIPPGAKIAFARLYWAGNTGRYRLGRSLLTRCDASRADATLPSGKPLTSPVKVRVGGGAVRSVAPRKAVDSPMAESGPHYYTAEADVRGQLAEAPTGQPVRVTVGDVWAPAGYGCIGGWALNVVYRYDRPNAAYAPHKRAVYVYSGHVLQRSANPPTSIDVRGFQMSSAGSVHAGVIAYEGDWNVQGSRLAVNDHLIANPDGGGGTNKFFDSYAAGAVDPGVPNNMSVDAKDATLPRGVIPAGSDSARLTFSTKGDTYLPQALALSVPLPDIVIDKTVRPRRVHPGGTVHYTITIHNRGGVEEPAARITDDLADVVDDARYNGDAHATIGTVTYHKPRLEWHGDLPAGATAKVTYSATARKLSRGNGRMRNVVISSYDSSCTHHPTAPGCRTVTVKVPRGPIKDGHR